MKRSSPLRRATPLRCSKKRLKIRIRKRDLEWARAVKERDHFLCRRSESHWPFDRHMVSSRDPRTWEIRRHGIHACHIFGRSRKATRFDLDNGVTLCMGCHLYFHAHPLEFVEFAKRELGDEKFEQLRRRAMGITSSAVAEGERPAKRVPVDRNSVRAAELEEPNDDGSPEERTPSLEVQRRDALRR